MRPGRTRVSAVGLAVALSATFVPMRAGAFVRTLTKTTTKATFWKEGCTSITIYPGDFPEKAFVPVTSIAKSVAAAAHAWGPDTVTCADGTHPDFEIVPTLALADATTPALADDARNVLVFRTEFWTLEGTPDGFALDPDALAYTHVTSYPDGHIADVDILVNGASPTLRWRDFDPGVTPSPDHGDTVREFDLQAALTHEFGHFLGFAHTCVEPGTFDVRPLDDQDRDVPDCGAAPEEVTRSVMFFRNRENDSSKRVLSPDDVRAVCAVYPRGSAARSCAVDRPYDGCAVAPPRRGRGAAAGAGLVSTWAAASALVRARRRRRARA